MVSSEQCGYRIGIFQSDVTPAVLEHISRLIVFVDFEDLLLVLGLSFWCPNG